MLIFFFQCNLTECLEMMACNVGQGNGIFIRNLEEKKAVVFDYGHFKNDTFAKKKWNDFSVGGSGRAVVNFLKEMEVTVFITHSHYDHHSLLDTLSANGVKVTAAYISLGGEGSFPPIRCSPIDITTNKIDISQALGSRALVQQIFYASIPTSKNPNDFSAPFVITHGTDNKILITGDASGYSLDLVQQYLYAHPEDEEKLQNITFMVLPHHGSNEDGGFAWFDFIKSNVISDFKCPLVTLISSDPNGMHKLPWFGVTRFVCSRNGAPSEVPLHMVSTANGDIPISEPIFLTKNARCGFWTVTFDLGGNIGMYDGRPVNEDGIFDEWFNQLFNQISEPLDFSEKIAEYNDIPNETSEKKRNILKDLIRNVVYLYNSDALIEYTNFIFDKIIELRSVDNEDDLSIFCLDVFKKNEQTRTCFLQFLDRYFKGFGTNILQDLFVACIRNFNILFTNDEDKTLMSRIVTQYLLHSSLDTDKLILECVRSYSVIGFNSIYQNFCQDVLTYLSGLELDVARWKKYMHAIIDDDTGELNKLLKGLSPLRP